MGSHRRLYGSDWLGWEPQGGEWKLRRGWTESLRTPTLGGRIILPPLLPISASCTTDKILHQHTLDFNFFICKVGIISLSCSPYCHEDHLISSETWWIEQTYLLLVLPKFH